MNKNFVTFVIIPLTVLLLMSLARTVRNKMARPEVKEEVQTPGKFDRAILWLIRILTILTALFALLGAIAGVIEMALVFLGLTLFFLGVIWLLKREYNMSYQENDEFFILQTKGREYKVYYENIIDWYPGFNEILLIDKTQKDKGYIKVNISMLHPEILLKKMVEMTEAGKFQLGVPENIEDPKREQELIGFLENYNYGYLIEDYQEI